MKGRRLLSAIAGAAVASIVAGVAYATIPGPDNVYSACMLKGVGTIRLIDKSLPSTNLMSHCTDKEIEISWNQAGQPGSAGPQGVKGDPGAPGTNGTNGKDGVSVTTVSEPGGANCAAGGVQLIAANGVGYVCNGKAGADGKDGANGSDGADGHDGVSVTSAVEPAGSNCINGGSKFTAANGVTYACNGGGSASNGPVLVERAGGATLAAGASVRLVDTPEVTATASCTGLQLYLDVLTWSNGIPSNASTAALWEAAVQRYLPTPTSNGASGLLIDQGTTTPQSFFVTIRLPNGMSFETQGKAMASNGCSIVYHAALSEG
jgi:hypothetical protein